MAFVHRPIDISKIKEILDSQLDYDKNFASYSIPDSYYKLEDIDCIFYTVKIGKPKNEIIENEDSSIKRIKDISKKWEPIIDGISIGIDPANIADIIPPMSIGPAIISSTMYGPSSGSGFSNKSQILDTTRPKNPVYGQIYFDKNTNSILICMEDGSWLDVVTKNIIK